MSARSWRFPHQLGAVAAVATAWRVGFVLTARADHQPGLSDQFWYSYQSTLVARGEGFLNPFAHACGTVLDGGGGVDAVPAELPEWCGAAIPTAGHTPMLPLVLAVPSRLGFDTVLAHRITIALLGGLLVVLAGLLARDLAGDRAGLLGAGLAAVYPHLWISDSAVSPETLYGVLLLLALLGLVRFRRRPRLLTMALVGAALGAAALTRSEGLLLAPALVVPVVLTTPGLDRARAVRAIAVAGAVTALVVAPWVVRNLVTFEEPVVIATGFGTVLAYGNCDRTYEGTYLGYWHDDCSLRDWPDTTDDSIVDAAARRQATEYIEANLDRVPVVVVARAARLWDVWRAGQGTAFNEFFEERGHWPSRLATASFYALVPLAVAALLLLRRRRVPIWPYLAVAALVTFTAMISFGITRYRAPFDVILPVLAAVALDAVLGLRRPTRPAPALARTAGAGSVR